jgi:hypothetical protein
MTRERGNWIPRSENGRYIVIDKMTDEVIYNAQGYRFSTEEKCWNWIRNMQRQVGICTNETYPSSNTLF